MRGYGRSIPLDSDRATFERFEERVEATALAEEIGPELVTSPAAYAWPEQVLAALEAEVAAKAAADLGGDAA